MMHQPRWPSRFVTACVAACLLVASVASAASAASPGDTSRRLQEASAAMESARTFLARKDDGAAKKRLAEAEGIYRDVLRLERDHREATLGLSAVLFLQRRYDAGVQLLEAPHERAPNDADLTHQLGLHLYRAGQQQRGLDMLTSVATDGDRFDAVWLILQHHYNNGDFAKGLPWAKRYAVARPDDVDAMALIGTYYLKSNHLADAIEAFDRYLRAHPKNVSVALNRANALFRSQRFDEAAAVYGSLLAENPTNNRYAWNLASVRVKQDRCNEAVDLLEQVLAREPGFGPALYFRADCLRKLGDFDRAEAAYRAAAGTSQSNPWIYYGLSQLEFRRGNAPAALVQAEKALELGPAEAELHAWAGTLLRRNGRPEAALVRHDRAVELAPTAPTYHVERGYDLFRLRRANDAVVAFEKAMALAPTDRRARLAAVAALLETARQALESGATGQAREVLEKAVVVDPSSGRARAFLALQTLEAGDSALANKVLREAPANSDGTADLAAADAMVALVENDLERTRRSLGEAVQGGSDLIQMLPELRGYVAAADQDWAGAANAFEEAATTLGKSASPRLDGARALVWLELGLDRLGRGDGGGSRDAFGKVRTLQRWLVADDLALFEFAQQALATVGAEKPAEAAAFLNQTLNGARYQTAAMARVRDIGQGYVAHAWLRANNATEAIRALDRVRDRRALGGAWEVLRRAATELEARRHFADGRHVEAERLWTSLGDDPIVQHNIATARFAAGRTAEAETAWRARNGTPSEALYNLANALGRRGEYRDTWNLLRQYLATGATTQRDEAEKRAANLQRLFGFAAGGTP